MHDAENLINVIMAWGIIAQLIGVGFVVLHIVLVIWIFSDYEKRGGGGCGGCFWALFVLHFGLLGLLCYLMVRPSVRVPPQAQQIIIQQPPGTTQAYAPPAPAAPPTAAPVPRPANVPPTLAQTPSAPPPARSVPVTAPAPPHGDTCPGCRAAVEPGDRFCDNCGARIGSAPAGFQGPRTLTIGREESCQIFFDQPQVSARHATLTITPQGTFIEDIGSTNGTSLRGKRLHGRAEIRAGDIIGFGSFQVTYEQLVDMARRSG